MKRDNHFNNLYNCLLPRDIPLSYGDSSKGIALTGELRARMERFFRQDLSAIRIHIGLIPELLNVHAVAHGTDLYFSPGAYEPNTADGEATLIHELVHVFQQMATSSPMARSEQPRLIWNEMLEYEAEQIAGLSYKRTNATENATTQFSLSLLKPTPQAIRWDCLQPNVHVMDKGRDIKLTNTTQAMQDILDGITDHQIAMSFMCAYLDIKPVLDSWIKSSRRLWKRWLKNRKERTVRYASWDSLARALLGEVRSEPSLQKENDLARQAVESGYVNDKMTELLVFINTMLANDRYVEVRKKVFPKIGSFTGAYKHWYPTGGIKKCLTEPLKISFVNRVAAIHDLVSPFGDFDDEFDCVPDEKCKGTILVPNGVRGYDVRQVDLCDDRGNLTFRDGSLSDRDCTLKEESEIITSYRKSNMPTGFGPSFTTGRTLQFCQELCSQNQVGNSLGWLNGCAWGLFGFWNMYYEFRYSRSHRFHEVMDMAHNYGVPWTPYSYPVSCPSYATPFPVGNGVI